jgi:hypothetical protein
MNRSPCGPSRRWLSRLPPIGTRLLSHVSIGLAQQRNLPFLVPSPAAVDFVLSLPMIPMNMTATAFWKNPRHRVVVSRVDSLLQTRETAIFKAGRTLSWAATCFSKCRCFVESISRRALAPVLA